MVNIDRVAKSSFVAFCSTGSEKCHFRFPYKSMTYITGHCFGHPARGALMTFYEAINIDIENLAKSLKETFREGEVMS